MVEVNNWKLFSSMNLIHLLIWFLKVLGKSVGG